MPNVNACEAACARLAWSLLTILGGVEIGAGCVIAAGALVNKNVPPNELWGSVPTKFIEATGV